MDEGCVAEEEEEAVAKWRNKMKNENEDQNEKKNVKTTQNQSK